MVTTSTGKTFSKWYWETSKGKGKERQIMRSKTFPGIASAMANQWGSISVSSFLGEEKNENKTCR
jgi:hypothetical protein